jgi:hypothetical protein
VKLPIKYLFVLLIITAAALLAQCSYSGEQLSDEDQAHYMSLGETTIAKAKATLMPNLIGALSRGGAEEAIPYCKLNADSIITSSLSDDGVAGIRRSSLKYRNKKNKATERDKNIFKVYEYAMKHGDSIKPILQLDPKHNQVLYYSPIYVQAACLQCHGNKDNGYTMENFKVVDKHYPKDKAFNYSLNDLRGMWVVALKELSKETAN